ncbi:Uncharacterized metal-binding protein YceD, DUF177 family [Dokdonia pacifica]|uniref:Uncharacterized metal-binding protein YceD, DUF177 family n=2 Tax=Dokdonia pacifica TaxID=1627892 RepID=A0A239AG23_9FLAO|nr:Uncharacterized metal-binding protein YceD, DUF177 family [Dokdonia pacifica]
MYLCTLLTDEVMKDLKLFTIQYVGLKEGEHNFEYQIDKSFFDYFEFDDFNSVAIQVSLGFEKKTTLMQLHFKVEGSVNVNCDLTNEPYDEPIQGEFELVVKFGHEYNDENEEILILPYGEYELNVAHHIYELIILSVPNKRVHPGVKDGTLKSEILNKLEELSLGSKKEQENNDQSETDPRWDSLKKLLTDK